MLDTLSWIQNPLSLILVWKKYRTLKKRELDKEIKARFGQLSFRTVKIPNKTGL